MAYTERYVTTSATGFGGGTSEGDSWTLDQAYANQAAGTRINVKAGSYILVSTLTANISGTITDPIVWRGYKTTPGDMDGKPTSTAVPSTDIPLLSVSGDNIYILTDGDYQKHANFAFTGAYNKPAHFCRTRFALWENCQWEHTGTSYQAIDLIYGANNTFVGCSFRLTNTSSTSNAVATNYNTFIGCYFANADTDQRVVYATNSLNLFNCIISTGSEAVYNNSGFGILNYIGNTIYNTTNGFEHRNGQQAIVMNNLFHTCTNAITTIGSTFTDMSPWVINNAYYNVTNQLSSDINADTGQSYAITESSDPLVDPANDDFSLADGASSIGAAYPYQFIHADTRQYADVGAGQRDGSAGSGGAGFKRITFNGGMTG
jgi:hypothetical protein